MTCEPVTLYETRQQLFVFLHVSLTAIVRKRRHPAGQIGTVRVVSREQSAVLDPGKCGDRVSKESNLHPVFKSAQPAAMPQRQLFPVDKDPSLSQNNCFFKPCEPFYLIWSVYFKGINNFSGVSGWTATSNIDKMPKNTGRAEAAEGGERVKDFLIAFFVALSARTCHKWMKNERKWVAVTIVTEDSRGTHNKGCTEEMWIWKKGNIKHPFN